MVESTAHAGKFLEDVRAAVVDEDAHNVVELRQAKARHLGQTLDATKLQRWDTMFYSERILHDRFAVDDEAFRPFFPPQESLRFVMRVAEKMYGVRYDKVDGAGWAPDVQAWAVTDVASNKKIATLYVDPYPRDGKYNHAAVWNFRNGATDVPRQAQSALVVNFDRRGLSLRELRDADARVRPHAAQQPLGHALRERRRRERGAGLRRGAVADAGGLGLRQERAQGVPGGLHGRASRCPTRWSTRPVPRATSARACRWRASSCTRPTTLALHGAAAPDPMDTWEKMEAATSLGYVPGTTFPSRLRAHRRWIRCGVLRLPVEPGRGGRHAHRVPWPTSSTPRSARAFAARCSPRARKKPAQQIVKDFLGRDGSSQAFFDWLKK